MELTALLGRALERAEKGNLSKEYVDHLRDKTTQDKILAIRKQALQLLDNPYVVNPEDFGEISVSEIQFTKQESELKVNNIFCRLAVQAVTNLRCNGVEIFDKPVQRGKYADPIPAESQQLSHPASPKELDAISQEITAKAEQISAGWLS
jgi:hypothetical protein